MTVLRPELVDAYWKFKMREWVNSELDKRRQNQTETSGATEKVGNKDLAEDAHDLDLPDSEASDNEEIEKDL